MQRLTVNLRRQLKEAKDQIKIDEERHKKNDELRMQNDIRFEKMEKELKEQIKKIGG